MMKNLERKLKRNILYNYIFTFVQNLDMSTSIWVLYLAYRGMNLMQIGLLAGIYHATSIIFEIPSGAIADILGRKKSVIVGRMIGAVSSIIMLLSQNFWWFAVGFFLQALGKNFNSGSGEALVYDSMKLLGKEEDYIRVNGKTNILIEVSQAIATVAGGVLAEYSYMWCYAACVIIALFSIVPAVCMTEPPILEKEDGDVEKRKESWFIVLKNHFRISFQILKNDVRIFHIIVFYSAIFAMHTVLFFYSQQYYYDLGLNKIQISFIMLLGGIAGCAGAAASAWLEEHLKGKMARVGAVGLSLCIASFGWNHILVATVAFIVANFFNSSLYPIQSNALNRLIPSEQRATLISVDSMFSSVVMILIFPLAGVLADTFGLSAVFAGMGVLLFLISVFKRSSL